MIHKDESVEADMGLFRKYGLMLDRDYFSKQGDTVFFGWYCEKQSSAKIRLKIVVRQAENGEFLVRINPDYRGAPEKTYRARTPQETIDTIENIVNGNTHEDFGLFRSKGLNLDKRLFREDGSDILQGWSGAIDSVSGIEIRMEVLAESIGYKVRVYLPDTGLEFQDRAVKQDEALEILSNLISKAIMRAREARDAA